MPLTAHSVSLSGSWSTIAALIAADGSAARPEFASLAAPATPMRDVSDAVHALAMVHGRHPGLIDLALNNDAHPAMHEWLDAAATGFAIERSYLAQLTAAAGPLPSTPGQPNTDAAIAAQCHALDMLAQSDRAGCASGAALALALDWSSIRALLDGAANRLGLETPACQLPVETDTATLIATLTSSAAIERAMAFGAQQLLAQHRGLWDLLAARIDARDTL